MTIGCNKVNFCKSEIKSILAKNICITSIWNLHWGKKWLRAPHISWHQPSEFEKGWLRKCKPKTINAHFKLWWKTTMKTHTLPLSASQSGKTIRSCSLRDTFSQTHRLSLVWLQKSCTSSICPGAWGEKQSAVRILGSEAQRYRQSGFGSNVIVPLMTVEPLFLN